MLCRIHLTYKFCQKVEIRQMLLGHTTSVKVQVQITNAMSIHLAVEYLRSHKLFFHHRQFIGFLANICHIQHGNGSQSLGTVLCLLALLELLAGLNQFFNLLFGKSSFLLCQNLFLGSFSLGSQSLARRKDYHSLMGIIQKTLLDKFLEIISFQPFFHTGQQVFIIKGILRLPIIKPGFHGSKAINKSFGC